MEIIILNWQKPLMFSDWKNLKNNIGVYFYTVITKGFERISYVGRGKLNDCQKLHFNKLKKWDCGFYDYEKIINKDYYNLCSEDRYFKSFDDMLMIDGNMNREKWIRDNDEQYRISNTEKIIENSRIFYSLVHDDDIKYIRTIEANLQYNLIKKFKLVVYSCGFFNVGLAKNSSVDKSVILENNLDALEKESLNLFKEHGFNKLINISSDTDEAISKIKSKTCNQKWDQLSDFVKQIYDIQYNRMLSWRKRYDKKEYVYKTALNTVYQLLTCEILWGYLCDSFSNKIEIEEFTEAYSLIQKKSGDTALAFVLSGLEENFRTLDRVSVLDMNQLRNIVSEAQKGNKEKIAEIEHIYLWYTGSVELVYGWAALGLNGLDMQHAVSEMCGILIGGDYSIMNIAVYNFGQIIGVCYEPLENF